MTLAISVAAADVVVDDDDAVVAAVFGCSNGSSSADFDRSSFTTPPSPALSRCISLSHHPLHLTVIHLFRESETGRFSPIASRAPSTSAEVWVSLRTRPGATHTSMS